MKVRHLTVSKRAALAFVLISYSIISYFIERSYGGEWITWSPAIGALGLIWYLKIFYKTDRDVLLTGFFQTYYSTGMLLSAALIYSGTYMIEIAEYGNANGIFWVIVAFFVAGLEANRWGYQLGGKFHLGISVQKLSRNSGNVLILSICLAAVLISGYVFINFSGPVLLGTDRVTFWRELVPAYLSFIPTLIIQSFFFVAFYYLWARRSEQSSKLPTTILVLYVLIGLFVLGQKLSLFILFITAWFALLPGVYPNFVIKTKHKIALLIVIAFLIASVLISYALQDKEAVFALARIALQAQLLWSVFNDPSAHHFWLGERPCYFGCGQFVSGQDFISYKYLPYSTYKHYSEGGTVLSGFMPAVAILTIGIALSAIAHLLIAVVLGVIQRKLVNAVSDRNIVYSFLLYKTHIGLTLIWFASLHTAIPGVIVVLVVIVLYRLCFPVTTLKNMDANVPGVFSR